MQNQFCCYSFSGWYSSPLSPVISWNLSSMVSDPHRHMSVRHTSGLHFTALQLFSNREVRWGTSDDFTASFLHFLCFLSSSGYNESSRHILHTEQPSRGTLSLGRTVFTSHITHRIAKWTDTKSWPDRLHITYYTQNSQVDRH